MRLSTAAGTVPPVARVGGGRTSTGSESRRANREGRLNICLPTAPVRRPVSVTDSKPLERPVTTAVYRLSHRSLALELEDLCL